MKNIITAILLFTYLQSAAQDATPYLPANYTAAAGNYIRVWLPHLPQATSGSITASVAIPAYTMTTQYYDGLGRSVQAVVKQGSLITGGSAVDMVNTNIYDDYDRENRQYLPFPATSSDGSFKTNPFAQQQTFYSGTGSPIYGQGETYYYSKTEFEPSPLNRVSGVLPPGNNFVNAGRGTWYTYRTNTAADSVRIWTVTNVTNALGTYTSAGTYPAGELSKKYTADEHGKQVLEYTDKQGQLILRKVQLTAANDPGNGSGHVGWLCTYYIYDTKNLLRAVIQPRGVELINSTWTLTTNILSELCFRYEYDNKRNMVMKKEPGSDVYYMMYDALGRLTLEQDGRMRGNNWIVTKYDSLSRKTSTWQWSNTANFATMLASAAAGTDYPAISTITAGGGLLLKQIYYDDYSWVPGGAGLSSSYLSSEAATGFLTPSDVTFPYPRSMTSASSQVKGMPTGTKTLLIGTLSTYFYSVTFYDDKARPIQVLSSNITGGVDKVTTQYSFNGQPLVVKYNHNATGTYPGQVTTLTRYEYDNEWRLLNTYQKIGTGSEKWIVKNEYDALGQLNRKTLSPATVLDTIKYNYNIRGWITGINKNFANGVHTNNWFGMDISYDKAISPGGGNVYNGNISGVAWRCGDDDERRTYLYSYDAASRLLKARFQQYTSGSWNTSAGKDYSTIMGDGTNPGTAYDANGNILRMTHYTAPGTRIDSLNYNYDYITTGNKLWRVTDSYNNPSSTLGDFKEISSGQLQDYTYDANGCLITDANKGINGIQYTYLNQPTQILIPGGVITFSYDAYGNKIQKAVWDDASSTNYLTKYIGPFVYYRDTLVQFSHPEGRVRWKSDGSYVYDYYEKDHLGSVRVTLTEESTVTPYLVASMEPENASTEEVYYSNVENTRMKKPISYPATGDSLNRYAARLDGESNKIGPAIVLKVSKGDTINLSAKSWYKYNGRPASVKDVPLEDVALSMAGGNANAASKLSTGTSIAENPLATAIFSLLKRQQVDDEALKTRPKAFLNWILLDQDLKPLKDDTTLNPFERRENKGFQQVGDAGELTTHEKNAWVMPESGFVYIYTSNESTDADVYFDDLAVTTISGPLLEVNNTYPYGLTIAGISSYVAGKMENKYRFNGKEQQNREFSGGSGLEWYDYGARMYDQQVGRWWVQDPMAGKSRPISPYTYVENNPILFVDPDGRQLIFHGDQKAQDAYIAMLYNSTGNKYKIEKDVLTLVGKDDNFKGNKSQTLIDVIQKGIDAEATYTLNFVGEKKDDKEIFIDSYVSGKIDVSDLKKIGKASTAFQGALIGHFLNEVQEGPDYDNADVEKRKNMYTNAHPPSLSVESEIYSEITGDKSVEPRKDFSSVANEEGQTVIYEYNSNNRFVIQAGSVTTGEYQTVDVGGFPWRAPVFRTSGEIKSVKKEP